MARAPEDGSVSKWRIAAGALVLAALAFFGIRLIPLYYHNYQLQQFVSNATQRAGNQTKSDDLWREWVVEKAASLQLPVTAADVHIDRSRGGLRVDVHYAVRVDLPGYTVRLHFHPEAASN